MLAGSVDAAVGPHEEEAGSWSYPTFIKDIGAIAMGSTTYEWLLRHAVGPDAPQRQPWPYDQPAWVFSTRTLPPLPDADIRFVRGDERPVHEAMVTAAKAGTSGLPAAAIWRASSTIRGCSTNCSSGSDQ